MSKVGFAMELDVEEKQDTRLFGDLQVLVGPEIEIGKLNLEQPVVRPATPEDIETIH